MCICVIMCMCGYFTSGLYLTSASKRLSAFRSWSLVDVFASASQLASESMPDPDAILDDVTDGFFEDVGL